MCLLLQPHPDGREPPRFVRLTLQCDLFGGWTLVRESGQSGGNSTVRRDQYLDQAQAQAALARARDARMRQGYLSVPETGPVPA